MANFFLAIAQAGNLLYLRGFLFYRLIQNKVGKLKIRFTHYHREIVWGTIQRPCILWWVWLIVSVWEMGKSF